MLSSAVLTAAVAVGGPTATAHATLSSFTVTIAQIPTPGLLVDVYNASQNPGATIIQWPANIGLNQDWTFIPSGGYINNVPVYMIQSANNDNMCITADENAGDAVYQESCTGALNQLWAVNVGSSNVATIQNILTNYMLDVSGASTSQGAQIDTWFANGQPNQQFLLGPTPQDSAFWTNTLSPENPNEPNPMVLDDPDSSTSPGSDGIVWPPNGQSNQEWTFIPFGGWNYEIMNNASFLCITTDGIPGDDVTQQKCIDSYNQLFNTYLTLTPDNYVCSRSNYSSITSDYTDPSDDVLDVQGGDNVGEGATIDLYPNHGGANQIFCAGGS